MIKPGDRFKYRANSGEPWRLFVVMNVSGERVELKRPDDGTPDLNRTISLRERDLYDAMRFCRG